MKITGEGARVLEDSGSVWLLKSGQCARLFLVTIIVVEHPSECVYHCVLNLVDRQGSWVVQLGPDLSPMACVFENVVKLLLGERARLVHPGPSLSHMLTSKKDLIQLRVSNDLRAKAHLQDVR